jgi:phage shock protein E
MSHQQRPARRTRLALLVALGALGIAACGGDDTNLPVADAASETAPAVVAEVPAFGLVSPQQASELSTTEGVTVIDVRTPEEFAEGHIDGAMMIDFYADTFADQIGALDQDGTYLVYCRSGNRSGQATSLMRQLGFQQVYDMDGGVVAYGQSGLPLVR